MYDIRLPFIILVLTACGSASVKNDVDARPDDAEPPPGAFEVVGGTDNVDLGQYDVGTTNSHVFTFRNTGQPIEAGVTFTPSSANEVTKINDTCNGKTIGTNETCDIEIQIVPARPGQLTGGLAVSSGPGTTTASVTATGQTTVNVTVSGGGSTTETAMGDCTSSCTHVYTTTTAISITGSVADNTKYSDFSGCSSTQNNACDVTLDAAVKDITVGFPTKPKLTVNVTDPSNVGSVSLTNDGPSCGTNCTYQHPSDVVGITPTPAAFFEQWAGCDNVVGNLCEVDTMGSSNRTVTATFQQTRTLTVDISTAGNSVDLQPSPPNNIGYCDVSSTPCDFVYPDNSQVTIRAHNSSQNLRWSVFPFGAKQSGCTDGNLVCDVKLDNTTNDVSVILFDGFQ